MEFLYSLSESFKDITNLKIKKISIINGIFWAVVWAILGILFWKDVTHFTSYMITLLPFKFIQNAGAQFILMIIWLQAVLVTIGIIFSLFNQVINKKFLPIFISFVIGVIWFIVFFIYQDTILLYLQKMIRIFPFEGIEEAVSIVLSIFIFYSFYIASTYFGFLLGSVKFLEELKEKEYGGIQTTKQFSPIKLFLIVLRDLILFMVGLFVIYPLLFIPFINIVIIVSIWVFLIKESILQTLFMVFGEEDVDKKVVYTFFGLSVVLNFIPIVNLFAPAFGVLSMFRYLMEKKEREG